MKRNPKNPNSQSGLIAPRVLLAFTLCSVSIFLAALGFAATPTPAGWSIITSPNTSTTQDNLNGVTCVSASDCWAVGSYYGSNALQTLTEHWDGTSWTIVRSPNTSATSHNVLSAVTCASTSECWAVGYSNDYAHGNNIQKTLIERWDGTSWAIFASENNGTLSNALSGVTCTSASECWAAGTYTYATGPLSQALGTLIEHWTANSTSWAVVFSPNYGDSSFNNSLSAVTCASASDCWAIGYAGIGELIERWNGTSWAIVVSPATANPNFSENQAVPKAVTCASASDCWVVGYYFDNTAADPVYYGFIERWNGTSWAFVPAANTDVLIGVTCASASDCWAVGPPIQHWDGTSWANFPSPNASGTQFYALNGVTCASASQCWAAGYSGGSGQQTLIEEFAPTIPPLTGVASRKVHANAGTFDIALPLTGKRGVECRSPGSTGTPGVDYKLVFSFVNNLTGCGTASTGSLSSGPGSNQCTVDLTGVANQQYISVTLNNVLDSQNNTGNVAGTMGVLIGDVNANGVVTNADVSLVKAQVASGASVGLSNFRDDTNANGVLSNADVSLTKAQVAAGAQLPTPP